MPASIRPQLSSLRTSPPESDHWLHEIKYDGYRTLARISPNGTRLITRNGFDWTSYYGRLASVFNGRELQEAILDGEVAVQEPSDARRRCYERIFGWCAARIPAFLSRRSSAAHRQAGRSLS